MRMIEIIIWGLAAIVGGCVFSFVNVLIYRVPNQLPFANDRSICPRCNTQLKARDLIPVFSYLFLKGRCRSCKTKISFRYPFVEFLGGILGFLCVYTYVDLNENIMLGLGKATITFAILAVLTAVAFVDIDTMEIPDGFVIFLLICGIISILMFKEVSLLSRVIGFFSVSVPLLLITLLIEGAFGGGDIKLMAVMGVFLGWKLTLLSFLLGVFTGGIYGIYLLGSKQKSRKEHFAFGPFLCMGIFLSIFWGEQLIGWYLGLL